MTSPVRTTNTLSERVAEEIRVLLARRLWSQSVLADRLGVSDMWVSRRLKGKQPIDLNDLERIAAALEVPVTALLPGAGATGQSLELAQGTERDRTRPRGGRPTGHPIGWIKTALGKAA